MDNMVTAKYGLTGDMIADPKDLGLFRVVYDGPWAGRPAANSVPLRSYIIITDYGLGGNSLWWSDGSNWRPLNGNVLLYSQNGSLTTPISSLTGAAAGTFVLPGGASSLVIPAGMCFNGAAVGGEFVFYRTTATATSNVQFRLGTAASTADGMISTATMTAAANHSSRVISMARFGSSTSAYNAAGYTNYGGGASNPSAIADRTSNVNTAAAMYATADYSAGNAADVFQLISYKVWFEG